MPLYDLICLCGYVEKDKLIKLDEIDVKIFHCPKCKSVLRREFPMTKFAPPKPFVCNDLGNEPVQINNLSHLERECQKRGLSYEIGPTRYTRRERPREKLKKKAENSKNAFS